MRFDFKELPGQAADYVRPAVPVSLAGLSLPPLLCLLDTGALHNRFGAWVASSAGIDLTDSPTERLAVGGFVAEARQAVVQLQLGEATWTAPIWFCSPWPLGFHLLGQEGFFRWFDVRIRTARYSVEVTEEV